MNGPARPPFSSRAWIGLILTEQRVTEYYDLIVVGSGPGGGSVAQRLAPTGKRILILERRDYLPR
jgi:ribulose 1,5-bisphosphate synthetase/thiazole synthase